MQFVPSHLWSAPYAFNAGHHQRKFGQQAGTKFLAVDISELDTKLVTAQTNGKLYGVVYGNTSGMS